MPRVPSIVVAAGPHIFIYRHLRPYRKWSCPPVEIESAESSIWSDFKTDKIDIENMVGMLTQAREAGVRLSTRSLDLLSMDSDTKRYDYANMMKMQNYTPQTVITCMEVLKKDSDDLDAVSLLVVGTECGHFLILHQDPVGSAFQCKLILNSAPTLMSITGLFDVEWRVVVACRDGKLYNIKNGDVRGTAVLTGNVIETGSQAVALARQDKLVWVATTDRVLSCYTVRGKRTNGIALNEDISDMTVVSVRRAKMMLGLLVALATGEIRMYHDGAMVYTFTLDRPISAIRFGSYGREENTLICVHGQNGALTIKIMRRLADIDNKGLLAGPPSEQDTPLPVPKKTKLFVEQTQREREQAPEMHRAFQRDLCKLRLETARAYVKTLTDGQMGASPLGSPEVRLNVQVQGLGPRFALRISLQNAGTTPIIQSSIVFSFDPEVYAMGNQQHDGKAVIRGAGQQSFLVPILLPGPKHILEAEVMCIDERGRAGQILLLLVGNRSSCLPMLSATVRMPTSELNL
eukprot:CAMPEP_0182419960 /NCGR_PEP_ID=MMETSP1167-20130531/4352_1 /TAXON_ID=2988 /ORGANISM="Mallomonas Sp, Strain CCMP3275" /LENGTH=517 /DNA_ID=CAMNT_0024595209 /DNA_START=56 /DNA_END=1609 /DNA_ORIENTATION=+